MAVIAAIFIFTQILVERYEVLARYFLKRLPLWGGTYHPGVGAALYCEFKMDKGLTLNPNLVDYKLPRAYEAPMTEVIHVITNDPFGPFGAK